ncbi:MAG: hypothetical protein ACTSR5_10580 [Promethearchaeota archaeon]
MEVLENFDGWLLDISTHANGVIFWVKTIIEEKIVKIYSDFYPEFFAVPKKSVGYDLNQLNSILMQNPNVKNVRTCEKYVKLEDHEKTKLLGVSVEKPSVFKATIKEVDKLDIFTLYNTDLPISQMYYYVNDLFPMSRCQFRVKIKKQKMHLVSFKLNDDNEKLFYELPPLKAIWLDVRVQQRGMRPYYNDPLAYADISIIETC